MRFAKHYKIIGFMLLSLFITSSVGIYILLGKANVLVGKKPKLLIIKPSITFPALQEHLYQEGYLKDVFSFRLLAKLLRYDSRILSGAYRLFPNMSNWELIQLLRTGKQVPIKLILDPVYTEADLVAKVTQHTNIQKSDFQGLLQDSIFVSQLGFTLDNILAMFLPNTYEVYWNISPQDFFQKMYLEYKRFWNAARREKAKSLGLTPVEIIILSSIVQKETNNLREASIIAGIYLNRLQRGMRLQACPTLLYVAGETSARRVLNKYQLIDSPYNTYMYKGLPPGPIGIPSIATIEAVLNAEKHNYLYFSAKEDFSGTHYFSKTFNEHKKNGERYRRALNKAKVYH